MWLVVFASATILRADCERYGLQVGSCTKDRIRVLGAAKLAKPWSADPGLVYFGHAPAPDTDSVAMAVGMAELFAGTAACPTSRSLCPNPESTAALAACGLPAPAPITQVLREQPDAQLVLVDMNARSQLPSAGDLYEDNRLLLDPEALFARVAGVVDHHFPPQHPERYEGYPYGVDLRRWGSGSSITASLFAEHGRTPSPQAACLLLSGILSDTLGLEGPTTQAADREMVAWLRPYSMHVRAQGALARAVAAGDSVAHTAGLLQAKSAGVDVDAGKALADIFASDMKTFHSAKGALTIGVVECVDPFYSKFKQLPTERVREALAALPSPAFVLIVRSFPKAGFESVLLTTEGTCARRGQRLAGCGPASSGPLKGKELQYSMGTCVSRKKQFQPAFVQAVEEGCAEG